MRIATGVGLILAAIVLFVGGDWLVLLFYPMPPGCLDGPCVWLPEHGPPPFRATDGFAQLVRVGVPGLVALVGLSLSLGRLVLGRPADA